MKSEIRSPKSEIANLPNCVLAVATLIFPASTSATTVENQRPELERCLRQSLKAVSRDSSDRSRGSPRACRPAAHPDGAGRAWPCHPTRIRPAACQSRKAAVDDERLREQLGRLGGRRSSWATSESSGGEVLLPVSELNRCGATRCGIGKAPSTAEAVDLEQTRSVERGIGMSLAQNAAFRAPHSTLRI